MFIVSSEGFDAALESMPHTGDLKSRKIIRDDLI